MAQRSPQDVLRRILRISGLNGWSIAIFAGICTVFSLLFGQLVGAGVGLMVAIGGVVELRGRRYLQQRNIDGMRLLVRAQLIVLSAIWVYAVSRLASFDAELALGNLTPEMNQLLTESGIDASELLYLLKLIFRAFYATVMTVTLIYQGGLAWYYRRRTATVEKALTEVRLPPGAAS